MRDHAYAGELTLDNLQSLLAAPPAALDWMILEAVDEVVNLDPFRIVIDLTRYDTGRAFGLSCEVRWQRDGNLFHTLLLGTIATMPPSVFAHDRALDEETFDCETREYYLWGEWSDHLPEWVEATIPHIFNYPRPSGAGRWRRKLITVEYMNRITGEMEFYRLAGVREVKL